MPEWWGSTLLAMRIGAPSMAICAALLMVRSYALHYPLLFVADGALLCVNLFLTYVEWFVFQPEWPGRRMKL